MSSNSSDPNQREYFYGWDLLYKTVQSNITVKADVLIALVHFVLTKHSNMKCVGLGEDKTLNENEEGTELLPDGWNDLDGKYALRYVHDKKLYLLLGHKVLDSFIINLLEVDSRKVSNIGLDPEVAVQATKGSLNSMIPQTSHLVDRLRRELIEPVFCGPTRDVTTQTQVPTPSHPLNVSSSDPLRIGEPRRPSRPPGSGFGAYEPRPFGFPEVGRGDLDPLGRGGPGNLFPFPSHPDFRAGPGVGPAQPRFDPFGPPDGNTRPNPNPDHLRPPNYGQDYYM